ncbi:putative metallo-hydrolase YycJ [subsurface metagenome]
MEIKILASGSSGNAYFLSDGVTPLLLEAGIAYKEIQRGLDFKISQLAGCLISHEHLDHSKAVKGMIQAGVDCYMSQGTAEALKVNGHRVNIIQPRWQFKLNTWEILPFEIEHDAFQPFGYLLASGKNKVLFATDTAYLRWKFVGLTHILIGVNYSEDILKENVRNGAIARPLKQRIMNSHMSLETLEAFLRANDMTQVQGIWLLHLSDGNADTGVFKKRIQEITGKPVYFGKE